MLRKSFPFYHQFGHKDCGPTCLKMIAKHYGQTISLQELRNLSETIRTGSSLLGLSEAAECLGFRSLAVQISLIDLDEAPLPCILHWNKNHYVVLYHIDKNKWSVSDPAHGRLIYTKDEFIKHWIGNNADENTKEGVVLLLDPTPKFYETKFDEEKPSVGFSLLSKYIIPYKKFVGQLILGLLIGSFLQLILPFLTQSVVDIGIKNQDIHFVYLILFAQLALFVGKTGVEVIRSWILLHLSTRINISLVSDFFIKLMNLPISFFDTRITGDILQRINDHKRIERVMTTSSLTVLFSLVNLIVFSMVLAYYNLSIFAIFVLGSLLYFGWIAIFLKKRSDLDYKRFSQVSQEQSKVIELIKGMQEIKLHNAEKQKRWSWEFLQARLFKVSIEGLTLEQYQSVGSGFINEFKNILITAMSAALVVNGEITLGMMLAISYIVGQLNSPIAQLIQFIKELQDAKISLERLSEIHEKEDETSVQKSAVEASLLTGGFTLENVSFRYIGASELILRGLNLVIPANKITAIVGASGSGKTTLMKLLLKFYDPNEGKISLANQDLKYIDQKSWRAVSGVVMQEGFIFNDTIANNIAVGVDYVDKTKLAHAVKVANIDSFIESLPLSYNTQIGVEGVGLSTGQKQRILIARAVYKNPSYLFFDEATSALDAENEKIIMENLNVFFNQKTVVVIAHRLSTVMNADQIVVLDKGKIIELGNHESLIERKGNYYQLIKNQLALGE